MSAHGSSFFSLKAAATSGSAGGLVLLSISVGRAALADELRRSATDSTGTSDAHRGSGPENPVVSPVVSITFRGPDGRRIPMPSLAKPINIRLSTNSAAASCAFWDEEEATWSTRGLRRLSFEDGAGLLCQTTHLTLFGAVLDAFLRVVRCSTASQVFSLEGFQNLGRGAWLSYSSTIISFSAARAAVQTREAGRVHLVLWSPAKALCAFLLMMAYATHLDKRRTRSRCGASHFTRAGRSRLFLLGAS